MLWKRFEIKSHQRRACYLKPRRNGGPIPTGGGSRSPPPTLTRVKQHGSLLQKQYAHFARKGIEKIETIQHNSEIYVMMIRDLKDVFHNSLTYKVLEWQEVECLKNITFLL